VIFEKKNCLRFYLRFSSTAKPVSSDFSPRLSPFFILLQINAQGGETNKVNKQQQGLLN
jgi:hypothetical protein